MAFNISVSELGDFFEVVGTANSKIKHMIKDAVDDVADFIEDRAIERTPVTDDPDSKSPPGLLKSHPVDRSTSTLSTHAGSPAVARIEFKIPSNPRYAIWVHEGTGPKFAHTPKGMSYRSYGVNFKGLPEVGGNPSQPYLAEAAQDAEFDYVPRRMAELRLELASIRGIKTKGSGGFTPTTFMRGGKTITQSRSSLGRFGPKL